MGSSRKGRGRAGERNAATRRGVLRTVFAVGVVAGTGAAWEPIVARGPETGGAAPAPGPVPGTGPGEITETYRGRTIRVRPGAPGGGAAPGVRAASAAFHPEVTIDGAPLHLMRRADGSYLSMVAHYESHPTPLAAARAAVDVLGTAPLSAAPRGI
ncbi:tyrosinase family oxidase copper chaperone [Streptomyces sp. NBC_00102]|uniref:tyrosinase family oxidase copper chaperone n=1 Tax=Streptomyces sp. NBC_00102 TaxID=2975652 RepID=UPI002250A0EE|nr:tyrosinase family oxidase copper chaperone [Streptomyces sp. NBC_00102]MCX5401528.1 tyrosinase cofactor [Streptomyces sp. NBC_00102]